MLKKCRESRKRRVTLTDDFERRTQKMRPTTLGYVGLVSHIAILLLLIGGMFYRSGVSEMSFIQFFQTVGFWILYLSIFGGAILFALILFAIGSIPFLFSSVARRRLADDHKMLRGINTAFALFDKLIFFGLIAVQVVFPFIALALQIFNNKG